VQVDELDRGWAAVAGAVVSGSFDAVGVVAGSFDDPGVGPGAGAAAQRAADIAADSLLDEWLELMSWIVSEVQRHDDPVARFVMLTAARYNSHTPWCTSGPPPVRSS
jgi:hypothetical protein